MTRRLVWSYVGLVAMVLVALVVPLDVIGSRYERQLATAQAGRVATGVALGVGADVVAGRVAELHDAAARYRASLGGEIEIFDGTGRDLVGAGTDADHRQALLRPLVTAALAGTPTSELRGDGDDHSEVIAAAPVRATAGAPADGAVVVELPAAATASRIRDLQWGLAIFCVLALALAAGLAIVVARWVARPLAALSHGVERLGRDDMTARVGRSGGPAELRALAAGFDDMADRLDELVRAQARFVADASHQLRSPLAALRLRLENLETTAGDGAAAPLAAATRELERLSRVVDGLLSLSRADQAGVRRAVVDVSAVAAERVDAWAAYAAERGIEVTLLDAGSDAWEADLVPGDLDQVLDNLLANALEAAPTASAVEVVLRSEAAGAALHVVDSGPGMPAEHRQRAFDRFWQGPGAGTGSSGLGLAIVRQLGDRNHLRVELGAAEPSGIDAVVHLPGARRRRPVASRR